MTVKIPRNFNHRPNLSMDASPSKRQEIRYEVRNLTTSAVHLKSACMNTTIDPITIADTDHCCVVVVINYRINFDVYPEFLEPETPLDAYIIDRIKSQYNDKAPYEMEAFDHVLQGYFEVGVARDNIGEFMGEDGGVHSRLLGISFYAFHNHPEEFKLEPSPYYTGTILDSEGKPLTKNTKTQIVYDYVNNTKPDLVLYSTVGTQVVKLTPKVDPQQTDGIKITTIVGGNPETVYHQLPDSATESEAFHKVLEKGGFFLLIGEALESLNNKSLQRAVSMADELRKEVARLVKENNGLEDKHGKLKEASNKQQLKNEQSSIWTKLFENIIKIPFTIIGHILESKLTTVLAPKFLAGLALVI